MTSQQLHTQVFIALASNQLAAQVAFYAQLLAIPAKPNTEAYAEFQLNNGLRLALFVPSTDNEAEFTAASSGAMSLCIEVDDLESAIARLTELGHPPPGSTMHTSHGKEIYAYDPDGNRLILHQS